MIHVIMKDKIVPISTILGIDYETTSYDQRVRLRNDYLSEKIKNDPKFECWDYAEYIYYGEGFSQEPVISKGHLISNKGRMLFLNSRRNKEISLGYRRESGYLSTTFVINKHIHNFSVHRVVASTFIPKPEKLKELPLNLLTVNHDDGVKHHNGVNNLEWMTSSENSIHALENNLYGEDKNSYSNSIFLAEYIIDDKLKGTKFIVRGMNELKSYGLSRSQLTSAILGISDSALGCRWSMISEEEANGYSEIPGFIKDKIMTDRVYLDPNMTPLEVTVVKECALKGHKFYLCGRRESDNVGFNIGRIWLLCNGLDSTHKGCTFKKISREETVKLPRGLSETQKKILFG